MLLVSTCGIRPRVSGFASVFLGALQTPNRSARFWSRWPARRGRSWAEVPEGSPRPELWHASSAMPADDAAKLRELLDLNAMIDGLVEQALTARRGLAETLGLVLPPLCARVGARGAFVRSFSEDLRL